MFVAGVAAALLLGRAAAGFPGQNGLVAYSLDGAIQGVSADDPGGSRVLIENLTAMEPAWSADGRRLAFSGATGGFDLYVARDGECSRLTKSPALETEPAWSPDGQRLAYTLTPTGGPQSVRILDLSSMQDVELRASSQSPSWSPSGDSLLVVDTSDHSIHRVAADGSSDVEITSGLHPAWSPDGSQIAFAESTPEGNVDIFVADADGSDEEQIETVR